MKKYMYQVRIITLLFFVWGTINLVRMSINFVFPFLAADFNLPESSLSLFTAWISIFWAIGVFLSGKLSKMLDEYKIFILGCINIMIGVLIIQLSTQIIPLYGSLALLGIGGGIQSPICLIMLNRRSNSAKIGTSLGIVQSSSGLLGLTFGTTLITMIGSIYGWRFVYSFIIVYVAIFAAILFLAFRNLKSFVKDKVEEDKIKGGNKSSIQNYKDVLRYKNVKIITFIVVMIFAWSMLISAYSILFLMEFRGFDVVTAGAAIGALGIGGFLGTIAITTISDYIGRKIVTLVCLLVSTIAFYILIFFKIPYIGIVIAMFLIGLSCQGLLALISGVIPSEAVPEYLVNESVSLVPALGEALGSVLIPCIIALVVANYGVIISYRLLAILPTISLIACCFLTETCESRLKI